MVSTYLSAELEKAGVQAVLITNSVNVRYLTGFDGSFGWCVLFGDGVKVLITDARYQGYVDRVVFDDVQVMDVSQLPMENLKVLISDNQIEQLGFEGNEMTYKALSSFKGEIESLIWRQIDDLVEVLRMQKSEDEIELIAESQRLVKVIFEQIKGEIRKGMSEKAIAWRIECLAREMGCDGLSFPPIVAINEHSASPHHHNTDRKFENGDLLLIDMGVVWKGYCSDLTRMIFTGELTSEQKEVYGIVESAQKVAIEGLAMGMDAVEADRLAREVIEAAGYGEEFCHSLGHGVGLEIHEKPGLSPRSKDVLSANTVVTVEPGIYLKGKFGVRIEDLVVVGNDGVRVL